MQDDLESRRQKKDADDQADTNKRKIKERWLMDSLNLPIRVLSKEVSELKKPVEIGCNVNVWITKDNIVLD